MKKLLGIVVLGLLWCNTVFSVESLIEGQKGTIKFESIPVVTLNQFLKGETIGDSVQISGKLQFPKKKWVGLRPAVVILHGGGGVSDNQKVWAAGLRKIPRMLSHMEQNTAAMARDGIKLHPNTIRNLNHSTVPHWYKSPRLYIAAITILTIALILA